MNENNRRFHHPFTPYAIQEQLMECIYDQTLEPGKKIAIVESPTGTGKTLSLICASVTWVREHKSKILRETLEGSTQQQHELSGSDSESEPEWVVQTYNSAVMNNTLQEIHDYEEHLQHLPETAAAKKVSRIGGNYISQSGMQKRTKRTEIVIDDIDLIPEPYNSDNEAEDNSSRTNLSRDIQALLHKIDAGKGPRANTSDLAAERKSTHNPVKIFFASRTHSQLNQFASQLKLPEFPTSFDSSIVPVEKIKYLPLGSKKQLCVEPSVKRWKTLEAINDACYELRHSKTGCSFYQNTPKWHESQETRLFTDSVLAEVQDIEELVPLGEQLHVCPYYAARDTIVGAEIITLPYQYLLSESTRLSMGLDIKDAIIIIDEAHNLIDTINNIYSAEITLEDLKTSNLGLLTYLQKFKTRLNPGNRVNLLKLIKLLQTIINFIKLNYKKPGQKIDSNDILGGNNNTDTLNIHKLINYITKSKIAYKVDTYIDLLNDNKKVHQPTLFKIVSFLQSLTNPSKEGQFFFEKGFSIKYMLLEPSQKIDPLLSQARCLILAGGTMEPIQDFYQNLFPNIPKEEITTFSCNHVIPDENLNTYIIDEPIFEFTFDKRQNEQLINGSLFNFYTQLASSVPITGGIVGFFPSYQYLAHVMEQWKLHNIYDKLDNKRKIFYETKDGGDILSDYINTISEGKGAILFAIVGGKLSEGINFQDNICRAVVMTGLPFPNVFSGELQIKKTHLEEKIMATGGTKQQAMAATKEFYENICMKAVNQSVGRAIRHANDYATIYLLDKRYNSDNIRDKLSLWVRQRIQPQTKIPSIVSETERFFKNR